MFRSSPEVNDVSAFNISGKSSASSPAFAALIEAGGIPTIFSAEPRNTLNMDGNGNIPATAILSIFLGTVTLLSRLSTIVMVSD